MRSPRRVCSNGSSHTAHSLPTKVRSRLVRLLSVSSIPAIPPPARLRKSMAPLLFLEVDGFAAAGLREDPDLAIGRCSACMQVSVDKRPHPHLYPHRPLRSQVQRGGGGNCSNWELRQDEEGRRSVYERKTCRAENVEFKREGGAMIQKHVF